jgi:hypothetical protein
MRLGGSWSVLLACSFAIATLSSACDELREAIEPEGREREREEEEKEREREKEEEREREKEGEHGESRSEEERENARHMWRVSIRIVGEGVVKTNLEGIPEISIACVRDDKGQSGECGPKLLQFTEAQPPLLTARGAKGWKFVRWETRTLKPTGAIVSGEKSIAPGQRVYFNAMGVSDKGECELLTAHFERQPDPAFDDTDAPPKQ